MSRFIYQARDGQGELATGVVNAASMEEASQQLRGEGKYIVKISPAKDIDVENQPADLVRISGRVKRKDVIFFTTQMAVMIETGVPLSDALECVAEQTTDPTFRAILRDVSLQVQAGGEFSTALRKYPKVFPPVMTALLRASEMSGTMAIMLERISAYMAKEAATIRQAKGAMMYPVFMMFMAIGVTIFLLGFVLPKFATIYESREATLPSPTRILMAISGALTGYWPYWIGGIVTIVAAIVIAGRTVAGRRFFDWLKLSLPLVGRLYNQLYITRACRTMGTMVTAGVSMLDMIGIIQKVTDNAFYNDLWNEVDERLRQGSQLSEPLFASPLIPRSIAQMIYSGEKSGQLGKVLNRVAEFTEAEFDQTVKTVTGMIEPIMVAVMGSLIGFVAISLLLPIFSVGKVMAGS